MLDLRETTEGAPSNGMLPCWRKVRAWHMAVVATLFIALLHTPMLLRGDDAYVTVHDNLDSELTYLPVLHASGHLLSTAPEARIEQVMGGIPRSFYRSGLNVVVALFGVLPPHTAYALLKMGTHLIALLGMYWLLARHWRWDRPMRWVPWAVAVGFAVIPTYVIYGPYVAMQPVLLCAFLAFRNGTWRWWDVAVVLVFPFMSVNYMITPFALAGLAMLVLHDLVRRRAPAPAFLGMMGLLVVVMVGVEAGLLRSMFMDSGLVSHRTEWRVHDLVQDPTFGTILRQAKALFLHGQYHSGLFYSVPVLIAAALSIALARDRAAGATIMLLVALIAIFILLFPLYSLLLSLWGDEVRLLRVFTWNRFFVLTPLLWMLVLAAAARALAARGRGVLVAVLAIAHIYFAVRNDSEAMDNLVAGAGGEVPGPSFREFYSPEVFQQVSEAIGGGPGTARVACLGFPPNVAQFNGLHTVDSYQNNYELAYKHRFRKVIAKELGKNEELRTYFDYWGSRCYLWSAELGKRFDFHAGNRVQVTGLDIDLEALAGLGATHILAAVEIGGPLARELRHIGVYGNDRCAWRLHVYAL